MLLRVLLFWQKSFRMFEKIIPIPLVKYIERLIVNFVSTLSDVQLLMNKQYYVYLRDSPRFFDQVGHETMCASSGYKHFFTKSCHHQTYQNYEQHPRTSQNS